MRYLSVCSGIEAATVAWHPLGWKPAAFSEIEKFPSEVLQHHYPSIPNLGDMSKFKEWNIEDIDLLVGGTPCQSFSVAGLRKGLDDPRGNLALVYLAIAERFRPRWILWENVPGVLSSYTGDDPPGDLEEGQEWETEETSDFETFLSALGQVGYGWAYRVLDAQYFGVPQRRRRVFVVGYFGDWRRAAAVLFERNRVQGHSPPSREAGKRVAPNLTQSTKGSGGIGMSNQELFSQGGGGLTWTGDDGVAACLRSGGNGGVPSSRGEHLVMAHGQGSAEIVSDGSPSLTCNHEAPILYAVRTAQTSANGHAVAFSNVSDGSSARNATDIADPITCRHGDPGMVCANVQVRRLTPTECERLQGFPDNHTRIPWRKKTAENCPDGPRYKALGNSMAVPCMKWLGERIQQVDAIPSGTDYKLISRLLVDEGVQRC